MSSSLISMPYLCCPLCGRYCAVCADLFAFFFLSALMNKLECNECRTTLSLSESRAMTES